MSARWPPSLLNSTNQQLTERIEQVSLDLESKRNSVAELREVVELLKKNKRQIQQQEKAASDALTDKRGAVERDEGKLKQLCHELDAGTRRAADLRAEESRLAATIDALEASMVAQRDALEQKQRLATELEGEAKEIVSANLARQRVGEELSAAQQELSTTVWAKLERLNEQVRKSAQQLADAREEHRGVVRELDAVQHHLKDAVREQAESVRALELVHIQSSQLDAHVLANAAGMETLQQAMREKKEVLKGMQSSLAHCRAENKRFADARDQQRSRYDQHLNTLRELLESLRDGETQLVSTSRRHKAEEHFLQQRRREWDHLARLFEEKTALLALEKARYASLIEARAELDRQAASGAPSPVALRELLLSLSRQKDVLEDRLERTQTRLTSAIQTFVEEGRKGEQINNDLGDRLKARRTTVELEEAAESETHLVKQRCARLEELLAERRALLPSMQALALEQRAQRQEAWMRNIEQLRTTLLGVRREYQQLRHDVTTLRSSLYQTRRGLESNSDSQNSALDALRLLEGEVAALEQEEQATMETERNTASQLEHAQVALQSLMKAADTQVGVLKETAGVESYLRAEVQIKEEQIQAQMQGSLVELHLHENELHELCDELQRHNKKLSLLRMRYEEVMTALARASQKPLIEEQGDAVLPLPPLNAASATCNPEVVHAHLLLRRSYEREQLMQRGNYLDLRLVSLDRETSTLRHMLDGLRASNAASANERCAGAAKSSETSAILLEKTNQSGTSKKTRVSDSSVDSVALPLSPSGLKDQLLESASTKEHYWKLEVDLLDEALATMGQERDRARIQLNELRSTLKELQATEKQKRMQLQKLRDAIESSHKKANAVAMRGIK